MARRKPADWKDMATAERQRHFMGLNTAVSVRPRTTIGGLGRPRLRVLAPASRLGGELSGTIMVGNEKQWLVPRFSYCASRASPQRHYRELMIT